MSVIDRYICKKWNKYYENKALNVNLYSNISDEQFLTIKYVKIGYEPNLNILSKLNEFKALRVIDTIFYDDILENIPSTVKVMIFSSSYHQQIILPKCLKVLITGYPNLFNTIVPNTLVGLQMDCNEGTLPKHIHSNLKILINIYSDFSNLNTTILLGNYRYFHIEIKNTSKYSSNTMKVFGHFDLNKHNRKMKKSIILDFLKDKSDLPYFILGDISEY